METSPSDLKDAVPPPPPMELQPLWPYGILQARRTRCSSFFSDTSYGILSTHGLYESGICLIRDSSLTVMVAMFSDLSLRPDNFFICCCCYF